jgi:hypothetical protein
MSLSWGEKGGGGGTWWLQEQWLEFNPSPLTITSILVEDINFIQKLWLAVGCNL